MKSFRKHFQDQLDRGDCLIYFGKEINGKWEYLTMSRESCLEVLAGKSRILEGYEYVATDCVDGFPLFRKIYVNPHADYDRAMGVV